MVPGGVYGLLSLLKRGKKRVRFQLLRCEVKFSKFVDMLVIGFLTRVVEKMYVSD